MVSNRCSSWFSPMLTDALATIVYRKEGCLRLEWGSWSNSLHWGITRGKGSWENFWCVLSTIESFCRQIAGSFLISLSWWLWSHWSESRKVIEFSVTSVVPVDCRCYSKLGWCCYCIWACMGNWDWQSGYTRASTGSACSSSWLA